MFSDRIRLTLAVGFAAAATTVAPAAATAAPGDLYYQSIKGETAPGGGDVIQAACFDGQRVVGGGASVAVGKGAGSANTALTRIAPHDDFDLDPFIDDGYRARAYNDTAEARTLRVYAICVEGGGSLTYDSNAQNVAGNDFDLSVDCPSDAKVIGGGADVSELTSTGSALTGVWPYDETDSDKAPDDGWRLHAQRSSSQLLPVQVDAICQPEGERKVRYVASKKSIAGDQTGALRASCPKRFHVASGGAGARFRLRASVPFDSGDADTSTDDGWKAKVLNPSSKAQSLKVTAVCVR